MNDAGRDRLGLLVVAGPGEATAEWIEDLRRFLASGAEVFLYLLDRAVLHLTAGVLPDPLPARLRLHACAFGARRYGVPMTGPAVFCGLTLLHNIVTGCTLFRSVPAPAAIDREDPGRSSIGTPADGSPPSKEARNAGGMSGAGPPAGGGDLPSGERVGGIVVWIRHDPRSSHLPVEGLRVAAGLTVGQTAVTVWLDPPAAALTDLPEGEVVDGERRDAYLDILDRRGVCVRSGAVDPADLAHPVAAAWRLLTI